MTQVGLLEGVADSQLRIRI